MAVRSIKRIPTYVWIPPVYNALYKIEIIRSDETVDDITDIIYEGEIIDGVTDTIGNFTFTIDNSSEIYTGVWVGNEILNFYCDYDLTATTKRFRGRIEKVSYQDFKIKITGRSESAKLLGIAVTKSYENIESSIILKDLLNTYASDFTVNNVNSSDTNVTVNWYQKPFWECVQELCRSSGFDCYIDSDLDCHYFESGSVSNETEAVIHDSNLVEVGDFAYDQSLIKNKVTVYGSTVGDLPLFYTAEDTDSQSVYGVKDLIINDTSIITIIQAKERADYELSLSKDPPLVGDITSIGLATIQPGERIRISAPLSNLPPSYYKVVSHKHKFDGFMQTILTIEKEPKKVYHILKDRISAEGKLADKPNPYEMKYSWNFDFNTDSGTHSTTQIIDGVLKTTNGSGTWISETNTLVSNATGCELRAKGEALSGTIYYISTDDGASWQPITLNTSLSLSPPGVKLKIKIELNSSSTQIDSIVLLYK